MPHCASDYPADPDHRKLSAAVLAALEDLPLRPSENQLRGAKFAGLQVLLKANGLPRPNYASVESMTHQLCAWLAENDARILELPQGVARRGWRPLGDPAPPHRAGRPAASGRQTRDMSPHQGDGKPKPAPAGTDDDLLPLRGAPAHPTHASRRSQASGSAAPTLLRRPYNGSGDGRGNGDPPTPRGASNRPDNQHEDDDRTARAAVAFSDSAASMLVLLDRLAPLIARACRGEQVPAEALASLGPAVHTAQSVLQGVVTGCTAERLRPTLTRASGGGPASATGAIASEGAPRTYAQVASAPPPGTPALPCRASGAGAYGNSVAGRCGAPPRPNARQRVRRCARRSAASGAGPGRPTGGGGSPTDRQR